MAMFLTAAIADAAESAAEEQRRARERARPLAPLPPMGPFTTGIETGPVGPMGAFQPPPAPRLTFDDPQALGEQPSPAYFDGYGDHDVGPLEPRGAFTPPPRPHNFALDARLNTVAQQFGDRNVRQGFGTTGEQVVNETPYEFAKRLGTQALIDPFAGDLGAAGALLHPATYLGLGGIASHAMESGALRAGASLAKNLGYAIGGQQAAEHLVPEGSPGWVKEVAGGAGLVAGPLIGGVAEQGAAAGARGLVRGARAINAAGDAQALPAELYGQGKYQDAAFPRQPVKGGSMTPEERALFERMQAAQGGSTQPTAQRIVPEKNIAPWASGPPELQAAVPEVQDALRAEIQIRRSGVAEAEKAAARSQQRAGIEAGLRSAEQGGASFDETLQAARAGARTGRQRQTFAAPLELTDASKTALGQYLTSTVETLPDLANRSYQKLNGLSALDSLYRGEGLQPNQIKLFRRVFGDEFAKLAADASAGRPTAIAPISDEARAAIANALQGERRITTLEQRAKAQAQHAQDLLEQFNLNPTDPRLRDLSEKARLKGLEFANQADALTLEQGRAYTAAVEAQNARRAVQQGAQAARAGETAAQTAERLRGTQEIRSTLAGTELTAADHAAIEAAGAQGELGVRRLELQAQRQEETAARLEALAKQRPGDPRYAKRAEAARAQADSYARQADELLRQQTATGNAASAASQRAQRARDAAKAARMAQAEAVARASLTSDEQQLIDEAKALLGEKPGVSSALDREAIKSVDLWIQHARQYRESIGETGHETLQAISSWLSGNLADSYLNTLYQNRLIATRALELSGTDPAVAKQVADLLVESQLRARYPGGVPLKLKREMAAVDKMLAERPGGATQETLEAVAREKAAIEARYPGGVPARLQAEIEKTAAPYGGQLDTLLRAAAIGSQEYKNLAFGPMDVGVLGQQGTKAVTEMGPANIMIGAANRLLNRLGTGFHDPLTDGAEGIARQIQYARDGLGVNVSTGAQQPGEGIGLLNSLGPVGRVAARWIEWNTKLQFEKVLGGLRNLDHEGNLAILKFLGRDITDPAVRQTSANFANVATAYAPPALSARRALKETALLMTPSMRRAQVQGIGQVAKVFLPGSTPEERILGSVLILNKYAIRTAIGMALNHYVGVGDYVFDQSKAGYGQLTTKLKNRNGQHVVVGVSPQDQIENAVAQSIRALAEADPAQVAKVWAKVGIGSSSPAAQVGEKAMGIGYQPDAGYRFANLDGRGRYGEGLTAWQNVAGIMPLPPIVQTGLQGGLHKETGLLDFGGFTNYPEGARGAVDRAEFGSLKGLPQFQAIPSESWRRIRENPHYPTAKEYDTYWDWYDANVAALTAKLRAKGIDPGEAQQDAETSVAKWAPAAAYDGVKSHLRLQWVRENPEAARDLRDENLDLPPSQRKFTPTKPMRAILEAAAKR